MRLHLLLLSTVLMFASGLSSGAIRVMDRIARETGGAHIDAETTDPHPTFVRLPMTCALPMNLLTTPVIQSRMKRFARSLCAPSSTDSWFAPKPAILLALSADFSRFLLSVISDCQPEHTPPPAASPYPLRGKEAIADF